MDSATELRHFGVKGMRWGHRKTPEQIAARQAAKAQKRESRLRKGAEKNAKYYKTDANEHSLAAKASKAEIQVHNAYDRAGYMRDRQSSDGLAGLRSKNANSARESMKESQSRATVQGARAAVFAKRAAGKRMNKEDRVVKEALYKENMGKAKAWGITGTAIAGIGLATGYRPLAIAGGVVAGVGGAQALDARRERKILGGK